jgi:hypothetical protein
MQDIAQSALNGCHFCHLVIQVATGYPQAWKRFFIEHTTKTTPSAHQRVDWKELVYVTWGEQHAAGITITIGDRVVSLHSGRGQSL